MENIIVCIIVVGATVYLGRSVYKKLLAPETAGCGGCGGCSQGPAGRRDKQTGGIMDHPPNKGSSKKYF